MPSIKSKLFDAMDCNNLLKVALLIEEMKNLKLLDDGTDGDEVPLVYTAIFGLTSCAHMLISAGANVNVQDHRGCTPLMYGSHDEEFTELLLVAGADPNIQNGSGMTALTWCVRRNKTASIKLLLEYGANIYIKDIRGNTALDDAYVRKHPNIISILEKTMGSLGG